jgi:hypothetical protein
MSSRQIIDRKIQHKTLKNVQPAYTKTWFGGVGNSCSITNLPFFRGSPCSLFLSHSTFCHVICLLDILSFALYYLSCDLFTRHSFFRTLLSVMWFVYSTFFISHSTICHVICLPVILSFALYYLSCDLSTRHAFFRTLLSVMWFVYSTFFLSHSTICHVICLIDILSFALYYLSCDLSTRHSF